MGTTIALHNGNKISQLHNWGIMPYRERSMSDALKDIERICNYIGVKKCVTDDAKIYYKNFANCKHISGKNKGKYIIRRGKKKNGLIASCPYYASKEHKNGIGIKEIADVTGQPRKTITKGLKIFRSLIQLCSINYDFANNTSQNYVTRYCKYLDLTEEQINFCKKIAKNIAKIGLASVHTPLSVASGAVMLTNEHYELCIPRKAVGKVFSVSEVTITKTFRRLKLYKNILFDQNKVDECAKKREELKQKAILPDCLIKSYKEIYSLLKIPTINFDKTKYNKRLTTDKKIFLISKYINDKNKYNITKKKLREDFKELKLIQQDLLYVQHI
jgi:transcription initiation factor TFIIIB Brf1 subunit/transcription initiation factor TFIIB